MENIMMYDITSQGQILAQLRRADKINGTDFAKDFQAQLEVDFPDIAW